MQYYTKQQIRGSITFGPRTLIGNWNEDRQLQETIAADFVHKNDTGRLRITAVQDQLRTALQPVELTKIRDDDYIHFGDLLQVVHAESGAVLSCDIHDKDGRPGEHSCAVTASNAFKDACARNTFLLVKHQPSTSRTLDAEYDDDVLRYGQKVRLVANPMVTGRPLDNAGGAMPMSLTSKQVSTTHYAKFSRHQQVVLSARLGYDSVWLVATPCAASRLEHKGARVKAGTPICLMHASTGSSLALETSSYVNAFSREQEVSCHRDNTSAKKSYCESSVGGFYSKTLPKTNGPTNVWTIKNGSRVEKLPEAERSAFAVERILHPLSTQLQRSCGGAAGLHRQLLAAAAMDGSLDVAQLLQALRGVGVFDVSLAQQQLLQSQFAAGAPGAVDVRAFLDALALCSPIASEGRH